jgi:hypothetical protein
MDLGYEFQDDINVFERRVWNAATAPASISESTSHFSLDGSELRSAVEFDGP